MAAFIKDPEYEPPADPNPPLDKSAVVGVVMVFVFGLAMIPFYPLVTVFITVGFWWAFKNSVTSIRSFDDGFRWLGLLVICMLLSVGMIAHWMWGLQSAVHDHEQQVQQSKDHASEPPSSP